MDDFPPTNKMEIEKFTPKADNIKCNERHFHSRLFLPGLAKVEFNKKAWVVLN